MQAAFHPHSVPEGWERGSGKRDGSSLCTTAESWTSIMMAVLSVAFSVLGVMEERSGSLRLTVRLGSSSACSLVSGLLQSGSVTFPCESSAAACGGLPFLAAPIRSASPAGTPFVLREGQGRKRSVRRYRDRRRREYEEPWRWQDALCGYQPDGLPARLWLPRNQCLCCGHVPTPVPLLRPLGSAGLLQPHLLAGRAAPQDASRVLALHAGSAVPAAPLALSHPGPILDAASRPVLFSRLTVPMARFLLPRVLVPLGPGRCPVLATAGVGPWGRLLGSLGQRPLALALLLGAFLQGDTLPGSLPAEDAGVGIDEGRLILVDALLAGHLHVPAQLAGALLPHRHVVPPATLPPASTGGQRGVTIPAAHTIPRETPALD